MINLIPLKPEIVFKSLSTRVCMSRRNGKQRWHVSYGNHTTKWWILKCIWFRFNGTTKSSRLERNWNYDLNLDPSWIAFNSYHKIAAIEFKITVRNWNAWNLQMQKSRIACRHPVHHLRMHQTEWFAVRLSTKCMPGPLHMPAQTVSKMLSVSLCQSIC